jgi:Rod binding domain-containing protein
MDTPVSLLTPIPPDAGNGAATPIKAATAARQFEALLMAQLLRAAHTEEAGWFGSGGDNASSQATAMAEEFLAQALASKGGLGLARIVEQSLNRNPEKR